MILSDLTVRTALGAVDLVPYIRRDAGHPARLCEWEQHAAVLALHSRGWDAERIGRAAGLHSTRVRDLLATTRPSAPKPRGESSRQRYARRLSERELIGGRWVHPTATHGRANSYSGFGCRCVPCSVDNSRAKAVRRNSKEATA